MIWITESSWGVHQVLISRQEKNMPLSYKCHNSFFVFMESLLFHLVIAAALTTGSLLCYKIPPFRN